MKQLRIDVVDNKQDPYIPTKRPNKLVVMKLKNGRAKIHKYIKLQYDNKRQECKGRT